MTDSFPRQQATTQGFSLGVPRSFQISPDGNRVAFLRSQGGNDPVTCLWVLDVGTGQERLVADPAQAGAPGTALTDQERASRERTREQAAGIVGFATDAALTVAVFALAGRVYRAGWAGSGSGAGSRVRPAARPGRAAGRLRLRWRAAAHRPGDRREPGTHRARRRAGGQLRPRRVHRGRGDGPHARLLVVTRRHRPAGGPGG